MADPNVHRHLHTDLDDELVNLSSFKAMLCNLLPGDGLRILMWSGLEAAVSFPESVTDFLFRIPPDTEPADEADEDPVIGKSESHRFLRIGVGLRSSLLFFNIGLG